MRPDITAFTKAVEEIVSAIPPGRVLTYGDVAALAGHPTHSRLVGRILGCIGIDSPIPCHRVVNAQGRTAPHWHSQIRLLQSEGIILKPNNNVDLSIYRWNPGMRD